MSRVEHWTQNKGVSFYPTHITRQLTYQPFAEYFILHLQILSQSDRFANCVQFFFAIGSILMSSYIAKLLGGNKKTQILAAAFCATIPMFILQSTSTQNDLTSGFFVLGLITLILLYTKTEKKSLFGIAACIALGVLTKATALFYSAPFILLYFYKILKNEKTKGLLSFLGIGLIAFIIASGYLIRYSSILHLYKDGSSFNNLKLEKHTLPAITSNLTRNIYLHTTTPFEKINNGTKELMIQIHQFLKIDPEDKQTTFGENAYGFVTKPFHEDHAGNFLHTFLILTSILLFFFNSKARKNKILLQYFGCTLFAFSSFILLFKWQPWHSRLQLPLFMLASPFIATFLFSGKNKTIVSLTTFLFITCAIPWVIANESRPLLGPQNIFSTSRDRQYFSNRNYLYSAYSQTAQYLKEHKNISIGLICGPDDWEYPFWRLLDVKRKGRTLQHLQVTNFSNKFENKIIDTPEFIINVDEKAQNTLRHKNHSYIRTRKFHPISIFQKDDMNLAITNLKYHLKNMLGLSYAANQIPMNNENIKKILLIRKEEFLEASLVDIESLRSIDPVVAKHFEKELLPGLMYRLAGYANQNRKVRAYGLKLISQWNEWYNKNKSTIKLLID